MNDEKESLHVDSSLPFKLLNENHVLEAIGLTYCTQDEVIKYLPNSIQNEMIHMLDLSSKEDLDSSEEDLLCDEIPLPYGLDPIMQMNNDVRIEAEISRVDSNKYKSQNYLI
jgi:hypothetical protein